MVETKVFIVAVWDEVGGRAGRILCTGRLEDGRSFAAIFADPGPALFMTAADAQRAGFLLAPVSRSAPEAWTSFSGEPLARFELFPECLGRAEAALSAASLKAAAVERRRSAELFAALGVKGRALLRGEERPGRRVDAVFVEPELSPAEDCKAMPRWLSFDIETDRQGRVLAISLAEDDMPGEVLLLRSALPEEGARDEAAAEGASWIRLCQTEAELLQGFAERLRELDPDILTGWNIIDFDLAVLAKRFAALGLAFDIGRTSQASGFVERRGARSVFNVPGRAAIDAMRLMRGSGGRFEDMALDSVARGILGEGKSMALSGEAKLARLQAMRREDPMAFCSYCLHDAKLVLRILGTTGMDRLTAERAAMTGVGLDLAWTSIPAFERVYGLQLRRRRILPPPRAARAVSGAAGGTVLEPRAGLFPNVMVFDFRSLYPSIMRTFNVDPLAHERAAASPGGVIRAPNKALFSREAGIMPGLIAEYAARREAALAAGDESAAYVYKILQNSFYGVLGAEGCRYARTELAGAITSFGKKYLTAARDFFEAEGMRVLYGDTDSIFALSGLDDGTSHEDFMRLGRSFALRLNEKLALDIRNEYGLESHLKIRCEKIYKRFLIPRLKAAAEREIRGRAKGYAGLALSAEGSGVEVRGMEAARSDFTPLARKFQLDLLELVFSSPFDLRRGSVAAGGPLAEKLRDFCRLTAERLRSGELDESLVYSKSLRRPAAEYASETPPVRAARMLGWTRRRGRVSYLMTRVGAEPVFARSGAAIDYEHYLYRQLLPIAASIAEALGLDAKPWFEAQTQLELDF